jgi:hypothetical protein
MVIAVMELKILDMKSVMEAMEYSYQVMNVTNFASLFACMMWL